MSKVTVTLRDTRTGETRVYHDRSNNDTHRQAIFQWTEGNYCCDCNRSMFFFASDDDGEDKELECNDGGENVIALDALIWDDTGENLLAPSA